MNAITKWYRDPAMICMVLVLAFCGCYVIEELVSLPKRNKIGAFDWQWEDHVRECEAYNKIHHIGRYRK